MSLILSMSTKAPKYLVLGYVLELGQRKVDNTTTRKHLRNMSSGIHDFLPKELDRRKFWQSRKENFPSSPVVWISYLPAGVPRIMVTNLALSLILSSLKQTSSVLVLVLSAIHCTKALGTEDPSNSSMLPNPACLISAHLLSDFEKLWITSYK